MTNLLCYQMILTLILCINLILAGGLTAERSSQEINPDQELNDLARQQQQQARINAIRRVAEQSYSQQHTGSGKAASVISDSDSGFYSSSSDDFDGSDEQSINQLSDEPTPLSSDDSVHGSSMSGQSSFQNANDQVLQQSAIDREDDDDQQQQQQRRRSSRQQYSLKPLDLTPGELGHPNEDTLLEMKLNKGDEAYFLAQWPNRERRFDELGPRGIEMNFGAQIFQQVVSTDKILMALKKLKGRNVFPAETPIVFPPNEEESNALLFRLTRWAIGQVMIKMSNVRIHDAALGTQRGLAHDIQFLNIDERYLIIDQKIKKQIDAERKRINQQLKAQQTKWDRFKGIFKKQSPGDATLNDQLFETQNEQTEQNSLPRILNKSRQPANYVAYIQDDHIDIEIIGITAEATAEISVEGYSGLSHNTELFNQKFGAYFRIFDAVLKAKIQLTQNHQYGYPTIKILGTPSFQYAALELMFDGSKGDILFHHIGEFVANQFKPIISQSVAAVLIDRLPMMVDITSEIIDRSIRDTLAVQLEKYQLPPRKIPYLLINDLRWRVENQKINVGLNLLYVNEAVRDILMDAHHRIQERNQEYPPDVIDQTIQSTLDAVYKWRRFTRPSMSNRIARFFGY
ncbi:hypothetical protein MIR68_007302 [Amoeboaphelidium protococcarum]|nr:hypothetical protein MIR68_007302 [Amoeboaphelidium protococcarum]